jgi:tetratricopeptide (TPR) repeat protein
MRPNNEILIDYLDKELNREESSQVENLVRNDAQAAGDMEFLKLAIETVRLDAISYRVYAIRQSFTKNQTSTEPAKTIVRSMYTTVMRIAAIFILFIGTAVVYKYISVNNQSVYNKQFTTYELGNTRGLEASDAEAEAYRNKNWNEVISLYKGENNKSNKSSFLAAMSEMQLNHFPQAVSIFESLLNTNSGDNSFREESEYYLSLAYLMNHEENKAVQLFEKIKADTNHTYYPLVSKISSIDLKIIELKNK